MTDSFGNASCRKQKVKQTEELSLELMKVDKAQEARKARRDWLRLMKVSPGIWVKIEVCGTIV